MVLRIMIVLAALALFYAVHGSLERIALLIIAAAASSSVLYGLGLHAAVLSAFRLLSHLGAYALIMVVAGRKVAIAFRQLKLARDISGRGTSQWNPTKSGR